MPSALVERYARRLIAAARSVTPKRNPWNHLPDAEHLAPLLVAHAHASAALIEYLVDTEGADGLLTYRDLIHTYESTLPLPPHASRCTCPVHDEEHTHVAQTAADSFLRRYAGIPSA